MFENLYDLKEENNEKVQYNCNGFTQTPIILRPVPLCVFSYTTTQLPRIWQIHRLKAQSYKAAPASHFSHQLQV